MNLCIAGSTGSVGTQALEVVDFLNRRFDRGIAVSVLIANKNVGLMEQQARKITPWMVVMADEASAADLKVRIADTNVNVLCGSAGIEEAISSCGADMMLSALVGIAGLKPTLLAIRSGMDVALANKESLVCAGDIVSDSARRNNVKILPVDSEHYALWQCLLSDSPREDEACSLLVPCVSQFSGKIFITASGGAFRGKRTCDLEGVTVDDALKHPSWSMGKKITVDSATLINKAFEVIEAHRFFNIPYDDIEVLVHPQSIVHSMVQFADGSVIAQLSSADMRVPLQGAFTFPERFESSVKKLDFKSIARLEFFEPDFDTFPLLKFGIQCGIDGGGSAVALNAANEFFVNEFLEGRVSFLAMQEKIIESVNKNKLYKNLTEDEIFEFDSYVRAQCSRGV